MKNTCKIIALDDHTLYLKGLETVLHDAIPNCNVYAYKSIKELESEINDLSNYNLLISDIELPGEEIFPFLKKVRLSTPNIPILIVSMHKKLSVIRRCKELNIQGYLLKDDDSLFLSTIEKLLNGQTFYSPKVEKFYNKLQNEFKTITLREEEVMLLICKGYSNQQISKELKISIETVKSHKKNIKIKLGISETSDLIEFAKNQLVL